MFTRRLLLSAGAVSAASLSAAMPGFARAAVRESGDDHEPKHGASEDRNIITLKHMHTLEQASFRIDASGQLSAQDIKRYNYFMRDHHDGQVGNMDPDLLMHLHAIQQVLECPSAHFEVLSAFRSPRTNRWLRQRSKAVARKSMHLQGQAVDIRLPGTRLSDLRQAAADLKAGGVGYYRKSQFVHFDTGAVRYW